MNLLTDEGRETAMRAALQHVDRVREARVRDASSKITDALSTRMSATDRVDWWITAQPDYNDQAPADMVANGRADALEEIAASLTA